MSNPTLNELKDRIINDFEPVVSELIKIACGKSRDYAPPELRAKVGLDLLKFVLPRISELDSSRDALEQSMDLEKALSRHSNIRVLAHQR